MTKKSHQITRRNVLKYTAGAGLFIVSSSVIGRGAEPPSDRLDIGIIGAGGRGGHNVKQFGKQNIIALCDVDQNQAADSFKRYEKQPKYTDFRRMLDKHQELDAVVVSTPDHTHAVVAMNAIKRGLHVYVEKPLAHTIHEVRALRKAAQENKVITQLGNQGHSYDDMRQIREWIDDGAIGQVTEVQAWYRQPYGNGQPLPDSRPPVPETLDWQQWLGPVAERPYHSEYLPGKWRSWSAFGTGVLGDWVCHILDPSVWALELEAPVSIQAKNGNNDYSPERFPVQSEITYEFAARGDKPPVKVTWTYGKELNLPQLKNVELDDWNQKAGALIIGDKGCILHGSHGGGGAKLLPESLRKEYKDPPQKYPRVEGGHHEEWLRACKSGEQAGSNFEYGGPLSELALLGVIATIYDEEKLKWDREKCVFTNHKKANQHLEIEYRPGWKL
ncbi:MAG: Gfo/Idh/MocA family oxidoreductase [Candidatus Hinthialibacter antarcticus]|nr:Gfo/Idh/MocA family oxidoreductase [Candidatus Hinthialibacter antarcticus]